MLAVKFGEEIIESCFNEYEHCVNLTMCMLIVIMSENFTQKAVSRLL